MKGVETQRQVRVRIIVWPAMFELCDFKRENSRRFPCLKAVEKRTRLTQLTGGVCQEQNEEAWKCFHEVLGSQQMLTEE